MHDHFGKWVQLVLYSQNERPPTAVVSMKGFNKYPPSSDAFLEVPGFEYRYE